MRGRRLRNRRPRRVHGCGAGAAAIDGL